MLDGFARAADDRLPVAVDVGDHHVAGHGLQDSLDFLQRGKHCGHAALVFRSKAGHFTAAGADGFECVRKGKCVGGKQRSVFAQAVSYGEVWRDAISGQQPGQRQIGRQHGRLSDGSLAQIVFGLGHGGGVGLVHEDKFAERLAQQRRHHAIGFGKNFRHNRLHCAEWLQHVHVLRALAGIQERHLGRGTVATEDALRAQSFPYRRLTGGERLECGVRFLCQFGGVGVVDSQAFGRAQVCFSRGSRSRCAARLGLALYHSQTFDQCRLRCGADNQRTAQRRLIRRCRSGGGIFRAHSCLCNSRGHLAYRNRPLAVSIQPVGNVFLEYRMEVGTAKTKSAQAGAPHAICCLRPRLQLLVDVKRGMGKVNLWIGALAVHAGRQHFVAKCESGFQQSGGARSSFEMSKVRFDGAQGY